MQLNYASTFQLDIEIENRREGNRREEINYAFLYDDNNESIDIRNNNSVSLETGTIEYESTNSPTFYNGGIGGGARSAELEANHNSYENQSNDEDARVSINSTEIFGVRRVTRQRPQTRNI